MEILITNDDSINAPGLRALIDCASGMGNITVVAPLYPQSAQSSALTVDKPLRIAEHGEYKGARLFSVNGTPVDCVKLALHALFPKAPDLLLSGINHGSNSAANIVYSGTMGAVLEGCMNGIQSVGFSLLHHSLKADFTLSQSYVTEIIASTIQNPLPSGIALNVNIPAKVVPEGVRVCRAAKGYWTDEYEKYSDPIGRDFYMLSGKFVDEEPGATDTDEYYLRHNYISVVPVTPDMTAAHEIVGMEKIYKR